MAGSTYPAVGVQGSPPRLVVPGLWRARAAATVVSLARRWPGSSYPAVEVQGSSNLTYPAAEVQGSPALFALVRWRRRGLGGDAPWPGGAAPRGAGLTLCAVGATGHRSPVARGASVVSPPVARKSDRLTL
jgi:hypothetical protein